MAEREELEVEIAPDGKVQVHVKGAKGKKCLDYMEIFRTLLSGRVESEQLTSEYYEAETTTTVHTHARVGRGDGINRT